MSNLFAKLISFCKSSENEATKMVKAADKKADDRVTALNDVAKNATSADDLIVALFKLTKDQKKAEEERVEKNKIRSAFGIPTEY